MKCLMYAPWFGDLPFYTKCFLYCCSLSKNILWVIHSDQDKPDINYENIIWFKINNSQLTDRIHKVFPTVPEREWKHKLCDLKNHWYKIFYEPCLPECKYVGFIDWDVVHNLSNIEFNFSSAKFTTGTMCAPLFIELENSVLEYYPKNYISFLRVKNSTAWHEHYYMNKINSSILQDGLTPEVDLSYSPPYAVHMYRAKHKKELYLDWINKYCSNLKIDKFILEEYLYG